MEAAKSKICRVGQPYRRPKESWCSSLKAIRQEKPVLQMKSEGIQLENSLLFGRGLSFCSGQVFGWTGWGPPTKGGQSALLKSTDLNTNLIQKHPHRNSQNNVWSSIWNLVAQSNGCIKLTIILSMKQFSTPPKGVSWLFSQCGINIYYMSVFLFTFFFYNYLYQCLLPDMRSMRKGTMVDIFMTNSIYDKWMHEGIIQKIYLSTIYEKVY